MLSPLESKRDTKFLKELGELMMLVVDLKLTNHIIIHEDGIWFTIYNSTSTTGKRRDFNISDGNMEVLHDAKEFILQTISSGLFLVEYKDEIFDVKQKFATHIGAEEYIKMLKEKHDISASWVSLEAGESND